MAKEKEDYFGLPHGEKDTPQLRKRFKNYVAKNQKSFGPGDTHDNYRLQRHNSFYEFNKPEYDGKPKAKHTALKKKTGVHQMTREGANYRVHNPAFPHNKSDSMTHKKADELRKTLDTSWKDEKRRGLHN